MEDKSSCLLQHQHTCCCLFGPSLPIVLRADSFIWGFLLIFFLQKGSSYFHPSVAESKRYLCTLNLSWSGCFYLESKLARRRWRKGSKHQYRNGFGWLPVFKHGFWEKGFCEFHKCAKPGVIWSKLFAHSGMSSPDSERHKLKESVEQEGLEMNSQKTSLIRIIMYFYTMARYHEVDESYSKHRYWGSQQLRR